METRYWRQMDFLEPAKLKGVKVTVIGCGGIGSWTTLGLVKLGVERLELWDGDKVEEHNTPNQLFRIEDIGSNKAVALADILLGMGEAKISPIEKYWEGSELEGVVIAAVDKMEVRKKIWEKARLNPAVRLFVDGRIGGENVKVIAFNPCDVDGITAYETTLFEDKDAAELPCTARAIIDVAFLVAALVVRAVRGYLKSGEQMTFVASMHTPTIESVTGG